MSVVGLLLVLVLVGVVLTVLPMDANIRRIIVTIVAVLVLVWLLEIFGVFSIGTLGGPNHWQRHY